MKRVKDLLVRSLLGIGLLIAAGPAAAQLRPSSEVLLPYFEIDLEDQGGTSTQFSVGNVLDKPVNVEIKVFTNWGIAVSTSTVKLAAYEVRSFDVRQWFAGEVPGRTLNTGEVSHLKAALTGERSPKDNLYYATQVREGLAVGYVRIRTLGGRKAVLWGDYFIVNGGERSGEGDTLINLDEAAGCRGICNRHALRFLDGGAMEAGTQIVVWSEGSDRPSSTNQPASLVGAQALAYDEAGRPIGGSDLALLPVQVISVADLGLGHDAGWIDLITEKPSAVAVHFTSKKELSIALMSYCLPLTVNPDPGIRLEKLTNGNEADSAPGPTLPVGHEVVWQYVVENTGSVRLTEVRVTDDVEGPVDCPKSVLEPGEKMTCTLRGTAQACQYVNLGTVRGKQPNGSEVKAEDLSYYFGDEQASIDLEKLTNGQDADEPTGPIVEVGSKVNWTYVVTNTGKVALSNVKVVDDQGVAVTCPKTSLRPGEKMTCTATGTAVEGQYRNLGTASGETSCGAVVRDEDPSHYLGQSAPGLELKKLTNGYDSSAAPGNNLPFGGSVRWDYVVTNTGKVKLNGVKVTDDVEGAIACPKTALNPGESMTCSKTGVVKACQYANKGTVTATSSGGKAMTASDWSWYLGQTKPALSIESRVNGQDADSAPGPELAKGSAVSWTYVVTNTGDVALKGVQVTDDRGVAVSCPKSVLAAGESMICSANGTAVEGPYKNVGTAAGTADTVCGGGANASDPAHYYGKDEPPGIEIKKTTNGHECDAAPGNKIKVGGAVRWDYVVTNTGKVKLNEIKVSDDLEGAIACPKTSLNPGESMTCSKTGYAKACQYGNVGTVTAASSGGKSVTASDLSFYFGETRPGIRIETLVNGQEADSSPGPEVAVGSALSWSYKVSNTGDVALRDVQVTDDRGSAISCPKASLAVGESMTCTALGTAVEGISKNVGKATGTADTSCGGYANDDDPAYYYGKEEPPGIEIKKTTNGNRCDRAPGNKIKVGGTVRWDYLVTNTGKVKLNNIQVSDDVEGAISCPKTSLNPGESMTCSKTGYARACQYQNKGTVTAASSGGKSVTASDLSFYFGDFDADVKIETLVNDHEADQSPGPEIKVGDTVTWKYVVRNAGDVALRDVKVSDDKVSVSCPKSTLAVGESMTCTASGKAVEGTQKNTGKVTATADTACGGTTSDTDYAYYYGKKGSSKQGCTPGYWKNHTGSWSGYSASWKLKSVFSKVDRYDDLEHDSLLEALHYHGGSDTEGAAEILLRAAVAALLNASHSGVSYPRSLSSVVQDVDSALASKSRTHILWLANELDKDNNLGCPLS